MKVKCPERATIVSRASMLEIEWAKGPWLDLDMIALGHTPVSLGLPRIVAVVVSQPPTKNKALKTRMKEYS